MALRAAGSTGTRNYFAKWRWLALASALIGLAVAASAAASEPGNETIVVDVSDSLTGLPLTGICVWISDQAFLTTKVDGTATAEVPAGEHPVEVSDCDHQCLRRRICLWRRQPSARHLAVGRQLPAAKPGASEE